MIYRHSIGNVSFVFDDLRDLLAKASPPRSGDRLAGIAADSAEQMVAARMALANLPLRQFLSEMVIPYEADEVTRLIADRHDAAAFAPVASLTVGGFRDWLLSDAATPVALAALAPGLTPEMVAAVSKLMRNQDLILVAKKCSVVTRFRNTIGLPGRMSVRLQPNHPFDDARGITASILDGLLLGAGDACIGINPASDDPAVLGQLVRLLDDIIAHLAIPTQGCVLTHVTTTLRLIEQGAPVDLTFQSIAGTEAANRSFGIDLALLAEAHQATLAQKRGTVGDNVMYFETGQGSALSANAHHGVDQQTCEARAYAVARAFSPLLVNSVVGFIGPEYLYDGKQIVRAGLEDHFCGKLLGLPLGVDICYTNHAEADQDDMDTLLTLLAAAGVNFIMGVPGADDVMLNYQSTSFHDALYVRDLFGLKRAPEFDDWLIRAGFSGPDHRPLTDGALLPEIAARLIA
ncbi:ethanolamine ammonia-lyase subunit EutB [Rhodopseudomonas palustris]|uniref:Ethanolamine ammonia-lyase large subunit n=1 Tax=Rhodopseudomonas palustris (strain ATCC BAA-98 / CGA009) TaxID=258594 RepID=Q6N3E5_RHOPA|nr:ethanolamine ammonia-lyase subunit EutB [Rhodopseudomonas palustris]OPF95111.1 ethanolamine ammonia lyase large subunit [Rhodopseudomonas palustris]PPQ42477.1 ethanolamine ammonia lyase large subunit [Rhodopseudomonas palustris]QQM05299.1 Ethanolamine ammonia-lyase heavy chain [Rhodopseudomonas palustris]RJF65467.1 ethanolamine ammonia-lyase subunit EutB [Rhodopseudomonas palustris]WAB76643.1 ethanolamine ammonia-lyase subunit EutB [Rhodopseudomonas palustris]